MRKQFLYYLLVFALGLLVGSGIFKLIEWRASKTVTPVPTPEVIQKTETKFILEKKVSAWLVWWDQDNGLESLQDNKDKISSIKPFWYQIEKDGSITTFSGAENEEVIEFAQNNNIKIIPVISNEHDPYNVDQVIKNEDLTNKHIDEILHLVERFDYDGIEINYESLKGAADRSDYSNFISKLAEKLHPKNKLLTTAVHAKTNESGTWEGPQAQDWKLLGEKCDQIKIMTYDYHWSTGEAGDIAPLSWMEEVLAYAVKVIDPQKIYLGIHFYGYDWKEKQAKDLTYSGVSELIERYKPEIKTSEGQEKYFSYQKDEESHQVYFADHETITKRLELANKYKIGGIGVWRLGQEDLKNWETIKEVFGQK